MKLTVLQMVQNILSGMDSDEVTSISDTVEAGQIHDILKEVFLQMCNSQIIPEHQELDALDTVSLSDFPGALNYMAIPDDVQGLEWIKYNRKKSGDTDDAFADLEYLDPYSFMNLVELNLSSATNVAHVTDPTSGKQYYVRNDLPPTYWTSFDDKYIATDAYDSAIDTDQVLGTKSLIFATKTPTWTDNTDDFIPAIDDNLFSFLLSEAKATAFVNLKQMTNNKIEKQARDQKIAIQQRKFRTRASEEGSINSTQGPNYGRRTISSARYGR